MAAHVDDRKFPITKSRVAYFAPLCVYVQRSGEAHKFYFHRQHKNNLLLYYILCVHGSRVSMSLMVCAWCVCFLLFTSLKKTFLSIECSFIAWRKRKRKTILQTQLAMLGVTVEICMRRNTKIEKEYSDNHRKKTKMKKTRKKIVT